MNTIENAAGKWYGVLTALGIPKHHLTGKHCACPLCGGKDRFRWDNKEDSGSYYCTCGPGYGIDLLMKYNNWDFKRAAKEVDGVTGNCEAVKQPEKKDPTIRLKLISKKLQLITMGDATARYLNSRGIENLVYSNLRNCLELEYYNQGELLQKMPAMVATVRNHKGEAITLHVTYLFDNRKTIKKVLPATESINGAAIRLTPVQEHIGIAEGIENAISVMVLYKQWCWAALNASCLETFVPPSGVRKVTIYGDNDASFTGQKAAYTLAYKLKAKRIAVDVIFPEKEGEDFNDILVKT